MTYDPQAVLAATRAYCAAATGAAPCEHEDTGDAPWSAPFTASTEGYVFTRCGLPVVVTQWTTPRGEVVSDAESLAVFAAAVEFMCRRLRLTRTANGWRAVTPEEDAAAWRDMETLLRCRPLTLQDNDTR